MEKIAFAYQDKLEGYHVSAFHLFNQHDQETIHFSSASLTCTFEKILLRDQVTEMSIFSTPNACFRLRLS
jgi:hypothetical protein